MKKIFLAVLLCFLLSCTASAGWLYNPFTGTPTPVAPSSGEGESSTYNVGYLDTKPAYRTGTVQVTPNTVTVNGTGAAWETAGVTVNWQFGAGTNPDVWYTISSVASENILYLSTDYTGATLNGSSYALKDANDEIIIVTNLNASGYTITADAIDAGSLSYATTMSIQTNSYFEPDGTYYCTGNATTWNDVNLHVLNLRPGGSAPTFLDMNSTGIFGLSFINANTDILYGATEVPHYYKEGTDLHVHAHWCPDDTDTGIVSWNFTYIVMGEDDLVTPTATSLSPGVAGGGVAFALQYHDMGDIPGSGIEIGDVIIFSISREAGDSSAGDAYLHHVGIHYECDAIGSRDETAK